MLHYYNYIRYFRKAGDGSFFRTDASIDAQVECSLDEDAASLRNKAQQLSKEGKLVIPQDCYAFEFFTRPLIHQRFGDDYEAYPQNISIAVDISE